MKKLLFIGCLAWASLAQAGSQAPQEAVFKPEEIVNFAKRVERYAAEQGAYAFIIARQGRPTEDLPKGIQYTHTAIAVYSAIETDSGETEYGYAIHNLYQRAQDPGISDLVTDYPVDFFWGAKALKAGVIIPTPELQHKLVALLASEKARTLHVPYYSVIASPYTSERQNCTEYTLDLVNSAIYNTTDQARLKQNTKAYFDAQPVHMSRFKLSLGSMFSSGVSLNDHPGKVKTATFTTIAEYLHEYQLTQEVVTIDSTLITPLFEKAS